MEIAASAVVKKCISDAREEAVQLGSGSIKIKAIRNLRDFCGGNLSLYNAKNTIEQYILEDVEAEVLAIQSKHFQEFGKAIARLIKGDTGGTICNSLLQEGITICFTGEDV